MSDDLKIAGQNQPASPVEVSVFDTASVPVAEQYAVWKESIGVIFDVTSNDDHYPQGYRARLDSAMVNDAMVTRVQADEQLFERTPARSYRDGLDSVMFQVFTTGTVRRDDESTPITQAGGIVGFDLTHDMHTVNSRFDLVSVILPRGRVRDRIGDPASFHLAEPGDSALSRLASGLIVDMQRSLGEMDTLEAGTTLDAVIDLIGECYRGEKRRSMNEKSHQIALLKRAQSIVNNSLMAGKLVDATMLGRKLNCSRATLYRAFEPIGGVASFIRSQRLRACLRDLAGQSRDGRMRTIAEIASQHGFSSDSHFSRLFKAEFGFSPSDVRQAFDETHSQPQYANPHDVDRRYELWLRAIAK